MDPSLEHCKAVKCILKYLRRIKDILLVYEGSSFRVEGYTDSSFQSDVEDNKSNLGYVYILNRGAVYWKSSKQDTTIDLTIEVKYIATVEATKEEVWMKKFLIDLRVVPGSEEPIFLYCDNNGAMAQTKEPRSRQKCFEEVLPY